MVQNTAVLAVAMLSICHVPHLQGAVLCCAVLGAVQCSAAVSASVRCGRAKLDGLCQLDTNTNHLAEMCTKPAIPAC